MQIHLIPVKYDERVFKVLIDFTGYETTEHYFPIHGILLKRQDTVASKDALDELLTTLKLRRIRWWGTNPPRRWSDRTNIYWTTVISDRDYDS